MHTCYRPHWSLWTLRPKRSKVLGRQGLSTNLLPARRAVSHSLGEACFGSSSTCGSIPDFNDPVNIGTQQQSQIWRQSCHPGTRMRGCRARPSRFPSTFGPSRLDAGALICMKQGKVLMCLVAQGELGARRMDMSGVLVGEDAELPVRGYHLGCPDHDLNLRFQVGRPAQHEYYWHR